MRINKSLHVSKLPHDEEWVKRLISVQQKVEELSAHIHYKKAYKKEELYYWTHIPKWLAEEKAINRVLDIGCAYGTLAVYSKELFGAEVYATDFMDYISEGLIKEYSLIYSKNNIELDKFPWDIKYDIIILTEVLEHLNFQPLFTLKKIRELLSENGSIFLSTPDSSEWGRVTKYYRNYKEMPYPSKDIPIYDDHIYQYSKSEILELLSEAHLKVEKLDYAPGIFGRHFNLKLTRK